MKVLNNFFTSGWNIRDDSKDTKSQYQMLNIGILLSSFGLLFGMISNFIRGDINLIYVELVLVIINTILFFVLRRDRKYFESIATILTTQFTILFLFLMYTSDPSAMKHVWLFTYPIILLYYQGSKSAIRWLSFLLFMIFIAPIQPFVEVAYSFHQIIYILFVVMIVASIMYFYKMKIDEAKKRIDLFKNESMTIDVLTE